MAKDTKFNIFGGNCTNFSSPKFAKNATLLSFLGVSSFVQLNNLKNLFSFVLTHLCTEGSWWVIVTGFRASSAFRQDFHLNIFSLVIVHWNLKTKIQVWSLGGPVKVVERFRLVGEKNKFSKCNLKIVWINKVLKPLSHRSGVLTAFPQRSYKCRSPRCALCSRQQRCVRAVCAVQSHRTPCGGVCFEHAHLSLRKTQWIAREGNFHCPNNFCSSYLVTVISGFQCDFVCILWKEAFCFLAEHVWYERTVTVPTLSWLIS